jgi:hypothetical protein
MEAIPQNKLKVILAIANEYLKLQALSLAVQKLIEDAQHSR